MSNSNILMIHVFILSKWPWCDLLNLLWTYNIPLVPANFIHLWSEGCGITADVTAGIGEVSTLSVWIIENYDIFTSKFKWCLHKMFLETACAKIRRFGAKLPLDKKYFKISQIFTSKCLMLLIKQCYLDYKCTLPWIIQP